MTEEPISFTLPSYEKLLFSLASTILVATIAQAGMVSVTDFPEGLSDSARIAAAVKAGAGGIVVLPKRVSTADPSRDW